MAPALDEALARRAREHRRAQGAEPVVELLQLVRHGVEAEDVEVVDGLADLGELRRLLVQGRRGRGEPPLERLGPRVRVLGGERACVEFKSSTRLQCERTRQFRRNFFGCASRTQREQSIRPKISRFDFDLTELANSEVWSGPPKPVLEFGTGTRSP